MSYRKHLMTRDEPPSELYKAAEVGTNLAEVGRDLISRQAAIDALHTLFRDGFDEDKWWNSTHVLAAIEGLPSVQQEQTEMIKEIRKWINSANRGNTDYFIVDKIEEIINRYE